MSVVTAAIVPSVVFGCTVVVIGGLIALDVKQLGTRLHHWTRRTGMSPNDRRYPASLTRAWGLALSGFGLANLGFGLSLAGLTSLSVALLGLGTCVMVLGVGLTIRVVLRHRSDG